MCLCPYVWVCHRVILSHMECSVPTRLKKRCSEVGCPFPTGSPFQLLEIPLRTKRPDMIPQHCRRGRELGTVLIRQALLSGKILKGMQPIVVNCMGPHSIPSAAGMCYLFWIGKRQVYLVMISASVLFLWVILFLWIACFFIFIFFEIVSILWSSHEHHVFTLLVMILAAGFSAYTPKCAFESKILIPFNTQKIPLGIVPCVVSFRITTIYIGEKIL